MKLNKRLEPSQVFTEIMSHINGALKDGDLYDSKLVSKITFSSVGAASQI